VTGIWFWGGGRLSDAVGLPATTVCAAAGRVGDIARGIARHAGGSVDTVGIADVRSRAVERAQSPSGATRIVVADAIADDAAVAAFDAHELGPALDLLQRGEIARLSVIADGNGIAARWSATPPTFWRRATSRLRRQPFAVPAAESS
jgi:hypothetical protein